MIPSNFKIEILAIRTLLCAIGTKGLWTKLFFPSVFEIFSKIGSYRRLTHRRGTQ